MGSVRTSTLFILAFWLASMSWLTWSKLRPSVHFGESPQHDDVLPETAVLLKPIRWRITLNEKRLGWAQHDVERLPDGQGRVDSTVRIEHLSLDQVLRQGFGGLGSLLARGAGQEGTGAEGTLNLRIENSMRFDHFGELLSFECVVVEDGWGECVRLQGTVREAELLVRAYVILPQAGPGAEKKPVYQTRLPLPPDKIVLDSLSPRPRFGQLRVGQRWTFETYNPLLPARPLQSVEAHVLERRVLRQFDRDVATFHVVYEQSNEDGLSLARDMGDVWVTPEGEVVRQSMRWGQMVLAFDRLPDEGGPEPSAFPPAAAGRGASE